MNILDVDYYKILEEAYLKHKTLIVCFDFDNTVYDYHNKGLDCTPVIDLLKRCDKLGFKLLCHTSDLNTTSLMNKSFALEVLGLKDCVVNDDVIADNEMKEYAQFTKPYANIYLDDKAGLVESYNRLNKLITKIENKELC